MRDVSMANDDFGNLELGLMTVHLRYLVKWTFVPNRASPSIIATIGQLSS